MGKPSILSSFQSASLCKRLWIAGGAFGIFLLTIVIGNQFIPADKAVSRQMLGHDFLAFYTAGTFVNQHRVHDLYNLNAVREFEQSTAHAANLEVGKSFGPWWNPPFYALLFAPLAHLSYAHALDIWRCISVSAALIAMVQLASLVMRPSIAVRWQHGLLVPLLIVVSMPFIQAISHGQNTFMSLLLLTTAVILWRNEERFWAGVVCGLLFYKPQLGAVVATAMVADLGIVAFGGIAVTGAALLGVTLIAMPGALHDWMHDLPVNVRFMQIENAYLWERHVTLKAFWRLLLQGREAGQPALLTTALTWLSLGVAGSGLGVKMLQRWLTPEEVNRDRLITATITTMPLLMPFYFDYDLLLLAIPAVLYAAERIRDQHGADRRDRWFTLCWVALFGWLYLNPAIAMRTHFNLTVVLLSSVSIFSLLRMNRGAEVQTLLRITPSKPLARAA